MGLTRPFTIPSSQTFTMKFVFAILTAKQADGQPPQANCTGSCTSRKQCPSGCCRGADRTKTCKPVNRGGYDKFCGCKTKKAQDDVYDGDAEDWDDFRL